METNRRDTPGQPFEYILDRSWENGKTVKLVDAKVYPQPELGREVKIHNEEGWAKIIKVEEDKIKGVYEVTLEKIKK